MKNLDYVIISSLHIKTPEYIVSANGSVLVMLCRAVIYVFIFEFIMVINWNWNQIWEVNPI